MRQSTTASRMLASASKVKDNPTSTDKVKLKLVRLRARENKIEREMNSKAAKNDKSKMDDLKKKLNETKNQISIFRAKL